MEPTSIILIFGPLMPIIIGILKKMYPETSPRVLAGFFCGFIGLFFGITSLVIEGETLQYFLDRLSVVVTLVFAIGTGLYKLQK